MFLIEIIAGVAAGSTSLQADAVNYGISLFVVGMTLRYRASVALAKGATMGAVGIVALLANATAFALLWAYRGGDSNMRSAWLCSRNDVIGNFAVLLAALAVFNSGKGWPDIFVAIIMAVWRYKGRGSSLALRWRSCN